MASITIAVQGTDSFAVTRTFSTSDENVAFIVGAYMADLSVPSAVGADGQEMPRDAAWAVDAWMQGCIDTAANRATEYKKRLAIEAAVAAVEPVTVVPG